MDQPNNPTRPPPAAWIEALERARADVSAKRTIPALPLLAELETALTERLAKKTADAG